MSVKFPQADLPRGLPRGLSGGADLWDTLAGGVLSKDYFSTASGSVVYLSVSPKVLTVVRSAQKFSSTLAVASKSITQVGLAIDFATSSIVQFSIAVYNMSIVKPAVKASATLGVLSKAVQNARAGIAYRLSQGVTQKVLTVQKNQVLYSLRNTVGSRALSLIGQSMTMAQIAAAVVLNVGRYMLGVQGAAVQLGASAATLAGSVVPRATLRAWLWQHNEEVVVQAGAVHVLRSGIIIFVVG